MAADLKEQSAPLHPEDLALAQACARGDTAAWDRFVLEYRPILYRAADAIDRTGGARELADALYGELFGLKERDGERQSLFRYFHGRSSLGTWLRAILAQRYVDHLRANRRLDPLPDEEAVTSASSAALAHSASSAALAHSASSAALAHSASSAAPDASRFASALHEALRATIAALEPRDRLRLGCYYAQEMTLVQIGTLTRESEATVSRQLARTRRAIKGEVEKRLRERHRFADREVAECLASVVEDAGELDLAVLLGPRKKSVADRSRAGGLR